MKTIIAICVTVMMSSSFADTTLTYLDEEEANTMQIKNGILRSASGNDNHDYMLFDSMSRTMTAVDHQNKQYTRIDESTMKQVGGAISEMQKMMEEQLKGLPPEQQAQMRQMMGGMMPSEMEKAQPLRSEKTSKTSKAGDWSCKIINVFKGDEKVSQICVASYKSLEVSKEDYLVMKDFMTFIANISENMPMADQAAFASADLGDGMLPVIVEMFQESVTEGSMALNQVSNESLDSALFTVPAGYTEQDMMQGMPR